LWRLLVFFGPICPAMRLPKGGGIVAQIPSEIAAHLDREYGVDSRCVFPGADPPDRVKRRRKRRFRSRRRGCQALCCRQGGRVLAGNYCGHFRMMRMPDLLGRSSGTRSQWTRNPLVVFCAWLAICVYVEAHMGMVFRVTRIHLPLVFLEFIYLFECLPRGARPPG